MPGKFEPFHSNLYVRITQPLCMRLRKQTHTKTCLGCSCEFTTADTRARYCSRSCSASTTQRGQPSKNRKYADSTAPRPTCVICGKPLDTYTRKHCSDCVGQRKLVKLESTRQTCVDDIALKSEQRVRRKQYKLGRYSKLRSTLVTLLGGVCVSCGARDSEVRLDFDHIDPSTKSFNVCSYILRDFARARLEATDKCQLLCRKCHCAKTFESPSRLAYRKSLQGSSNPSVKLTDEQRLSIFIERDSGKSHRAIASLFGVTHTTIGSVLNSSYWQERYATHFILDSSSGNFGVVE